MGRYILLRIASAIPVTIGVLVAVFFMVRLVPGDPVAIMFENRGRPNPAQEEAMRGNLGLDLPLYQQFARFVGDVAHGDLGTSFRSKRPVTDEIMLRLPNTLKLTITSLVFSVLVGGAVGIFAALKKGTWFDFSSMLAAIASVSIPSFWLALMLMLVFSLRLGWLPVSGTGGWRYLVLPVLTLGLRSSAVFARITRTTMLDVLGKDYVRVARAKGLRERTVVLRHALRTALIPLVTVLGFEIGGLIGGAVIVESVFAYPGMGQLAVQALGQRDFPLIQGIVLITALSYVAANVMVDIAYCVLDPRVRLG